MKNWERYRYELLEILITNMAMCDNVPVSCATMDDDCDCCDYWEQGLCFDDWAKYDWLFAEYDGNDNREIVGFAKEIKNKLEAERKNYCCITNTTCASDRDCAECELIKGKNVYFCPAIDDYCIYENNYKSCPYLNDVRKGCFLETR